MPMIAFASIFARTFRRYRTSRPKSSRQALTLSIPLQSIAQRSNIKERPAVTARATRAHRRLCLLGLLQWLVLCGVPYRGPVGAINAASTDPTNQLPTSLRFRLISPNRGRPNGHREAPLLHYSNSLRVPQGTPVCNPQQTEKPLTCGHLLRPVENTNRMAKSQPRHPCEKPLKSVGKAPCTPFEEATD